MPNDEINWNVFNINFLKCTRTLADLSKTNSITKTAINMKLSPSTVTRLIQQLEYVLHTKLIIPHGVSGITLTNKGQMIAGMYEANIKTTLKEIVKQTKIEDYQNVRILCHPLAVKTYVFPAIDKIPNNSSIRQIQIDAEDRQVAMKKLFAKDVDIIVFPISEKEANAFDKEKYIVKQGKEYKPALYLHKDHPLAKIPVEQLTIDDLNEATMMPVNKNARLSFFQNFINDNIKKQKMTTSKNDLNVIYEGILKNYWCTGTGEEFEKLFDCSELAKKEYDKMCFFMPPYNYWFIIADKKVENTTTNILISEIAKLLG